MVQLRVILQLLYPTPPSILTLVTYVLAAAGYDRPCGSFYMESGPPATIGPAGLFIWSLALRVFLYRVPPASLMVGPNYKAPSCPTATVWEFVQYKERKNGGNFLLVGLLPTTSAPPPPPSNQGPIIQLQVVLQSCFILQKKCT